jgi:hypothetical protein
LDEYKSEGVVTVMERSFLSKIFMAHVVGKGSYGLLPWVSKAGKYVYRGRGHMLIDLFFVI